MGAVDRIRSVRNRNARLSRSRQTPTLATLLADAHPQTMPSIQASRFVCIQLAYHITHGPWPYPYPKLGSKGSIARCLAIKSRDWASISNTKGLRLTEKETVSFGTPEQMQRRRNLNVYLRQSPRSPHSLVPRPQTQCLTLTPTNAINTPPRGISHTASLSELPFS